MTRIVIFAKAPQAGLAKTRLAPALGSEGAAALARRMLAHTLQQALAADMGTVELCMSPDPHDAAWQGVTLPDAVARTAQGSGDLGERMARAVHRVTRPIAQPAQHEPTNQAVLLIGTDCPALGAAQLVEAARRLARHDAVLLPASDGGYVLMGLKSPCPELFASMPWSTPVVALETLRRMATLGLHVWQGPTLHDIDEPPDLRHLPAGFARGAGPTIPAEKLRRIHTLQAK